MLKQMLVNAPLALAHGIDVVNRGADIPLDEALALADRIVLLGTRKALQNSATGGAVLLGMIEEMRRRGAAAALHHLEAGWVLEDNIAMRRPIEMFGGQVDKIHRIYEKSLQGASA